MILTVGQIVKVLNKSTGETTNEMIEAIYEMRRTHDGAFSPMQSSERCNTELINNMQSYAVIIQLSAQRRCYCYNAGFEYKPMATEQVLIAGCLELWRDADAHDIDYADGKLSVGQEVVYTIYSNNTVATGCIANISRAKGKIYSLKEYRDSVSILLKEDHLFGLQKGQMLNGGNICPTTPAQYEFIANCLRLGIEVQSGVGLRAGEHNKELTDAIADNINCATAAYTSKETFRMLINRNTYFVPDYIMVTESGIFICSKKS